MIKPLLAISLLSFVVILVGIVLGAIWNPDFPPPNEGYGRWISTGLLISALAVAGSLIAMLVQ